MAGDLSRARALVRFARDQRGVTAALVALSLLALIGFTGLGVEAGMWYAIKRQDQSAADAAALSAAFEHAGEITTGVTTNPTAAATIAANRNEFSSAAPNTIAVDAPICGSAQCTVQVTLTKPMDTLFSHVYLPSTVDIATSATAAYQLFPNSQTCLLGLGTYGANPPSGQVLLINGHQLFNMPNCSVGSVSTDGNSIRCNGCSDSGSWVMGAIVTAGGMVINGQTPPVPIFTQTPVENPYASVTVTKPSGTCLADPNISAAHANLSPGFYCGLTFTAGAHVVLNSGVYYIDGIPGGRNATGGNFSITGLTGAASITGTGVTIVLTNVSGTTAGAIDIDPGTVCSATVSLTAPGKAAGLLPPNASASQGLLIFQDPSAVTVANPSANTITTGATNNSCTTSNVTLAGAVDTPKTSDNLQGNRIASVKGCTEFIATSFTLGGTPELDVAGCANNGGGGPFVNFAQVEQIFLTQ